MYRSNRVERLGEALAQVVSEPLSSPFARECIVVQGPGMERWLSSQLAARHTVWAHPWFPFPRAIVELSLDNVLGEVPEEARWYQPEPLTWLTARVLPELPSDSALSHVAAYLAEDPGRDRLLGLAGELARAFDQTMVYRPELLLRWEEGEGEHLHARLWRALRNVAPAPHLADRLRAFHQALNQGARLTIGPTAFPERVSLFGICTLPPSFLSLLRCISEQVDVHFFLLTPSPEYWGDFGRKLAREQDLHALLASLGKVGRDLIELLMDVPYAEPLGELFETPGTGSMLHSLQADLVTLTARGDEQPKASARESDDSISVHVCHSELRELEVLHGQLRARFERDPTLAPYDVVVLAPDIERYANAIHAVFARGNQSERTFIPYHVADRKTSKLSIVSDAFFKLLALVPARLGLSDVLDLLHQRPVRMRFALEEGELDRAEEWLTEAGARWAIDAPHREGFDQPASHENTLRFALERLLLGYAAGDHERKAFFDTLPYADVEGREAALLGNIARFLEALFTSVRELSAPRSASAWACDLTRVLERMLADEAELAYEHHALRAALSEVANDAERASMRSPVSLSALRRELLRKLDKKRANVGFLSQGVTFCEHVPMRAIPFRVVCLMGMDDDSFPRRKPRSPFDVLAEHPKAGDRSLRDDDHQLFLEALLSARDAVLITYVGRSAKDDSARPASVLVDRLLTLLDKHFVLSSDDLNLRLGFEGSVAEAVTHVHALHRFDTRYFRTPSHPVFFSYDASACAAAKALLRGNDAQQPFVSAPLPAASGDARDLSIDALVRFYRGPQRAFLEQRLGVYLPRDESEIPDREPTVLSGLDRYQISEDLLRTMASEPPSERRRILRQQGRLPPGTLGDVALASIEDEVQAVEGTLKGLAREPDLTLSLDLEGTLLVGRVGDVYEGCRIERIVSTGQPKHKLSTWLRHLAYCATHPEPGDSVLVAREGQKAEVIRFAKVEDARAQLALLVRLHALGLVMPLPLFTQAAHACAQAMHKGKSDEEALLVGQQALFKRGLFASEAEDRCVRQMWSARELTKLMELYATSGTLQVGFVDLARWVFLPMLAHTRSEEMA